MQLITVKSVLNPLDREIKKIDLRRKTSLATFVRKHAPADLAMIVSVNGQVISKSKQRTIILSKDDYVVMAPEIHGGDTGKTIISAVVMIAAMAAGQAYLGPLIGEIPGISASVATALGGAIGATAAGLVINALAPSPKALIPAGNNFDNSQMYSWNPQTMQQQGAPIGRYYGLNKLYGNVIASYTENTSDDKQYLHALILLGTGPWKRIGTALMPDGKNAFWINDQPDPEHNYQGVTIEVTNGYLNQAALAGFAVTKTEYPLAVKVSHDAPYVYTTIGSNFDKIEIDISFPQGLWQIDGNGNTAAMSVDFLIEISSDGGVTWQPLTQTPQDIAASSSGRWSLGWWMTPDYQSLSTAGNGIWVEIPGTYAFYGVTPSTDPYAHTQGEHFYYNGFDTRYTWQWIGTSIPIATSTVQKRTATSKSTKPKRFTIVAGGLAHQEYKIRITRLTQDYSDPKISSDLYLSAVREVVYDDLTYPRQALVGIRALATDQLNGSFRFACLAECQLVRIWNGSAWSVDYSNNPAWVFYDAATQPLFDNNSNVLRYDAYDPSHLDLNKIKEWADWCDGLVNDGKGGTEKRCTFNGGFDGSSNLWDCLQRIAQVGRATPLWIGTKLTVAIDKPADPVQMFNVGNIITDDFEMIWLPQEERASEIEVDFVNAEKDYTREKYCVTHEGIPGDGDPATIQLFGVTKASEAWRIGRLKLENNAHVGMMAKWGADLDAIATVIGDVCLISHDVPQWGYSGRIVAATADTVTLDREVTIEAGKTYVITIRLSDDTLVTTAVTNGPGNYSTVTVGSAFPTIPSQYDLYAFGETNKATKPMRVQNIQRTSEQRATITGVEYVDTASLVDYGNPVLPLINYSALDVYPQVTQLTLAERLQKRADGTIDDLVVGSFVKPSAVNFDYAEIWVSSGAGWYHPTDSRDGNFEFLAQELTAYTVAAVTVNTLGQKALIQNSPQETINTVGKTAPPADVTGLAMELVRGQMRLYWNGVADVDLSGYEIQIGGAGTVWNGAGNTKLVTGYGGTSYPWTPDRTGTIVFLVKAIDTTGNYSINAAQLQYIVLAPGAISNLSQQVIDNIVELHWTESIVGTFPIDYYEVAKGLDADTAIPISRKYVTADLISEAESGTYKYWVTAVDIVGLRSAPVGIYTKINQPPDYVFYAQNNLDWEAGTKVNAMVDSGDLLAPISTTETFAQHFQNHGWNSPQDQVNAGFPIFAQPYPGPASFEQVIDLGAVVPSAKITMTLTRDTVVGTVTVTPTLFVSQTGLDGSWVSLGDVYEGFGKGFRYIKPRIVVTSNDNGIVRIHQGTITVDVKQLTKVVMANITDTVGDGTEVTFASIGINPIDIIGITGTAPYIGDPSKDPIDVRVNFVDVANPVSFKLLAWDKNVNRIAVNNVTVNIRYVDSGA